MYTELSVRIDMKFHNGNCCFLYWISLGFQFFIIFFFGIANCHSIQRITECGITCTPAVHCKSRPTYDILFLFCKTAPASLSPHVLDNMKISTVMKCTQTNRCSLYLNVIGTVILNENIRGVKICSMTLSSQRNQCMNVRIARKKQEKSQKVHIQANCFEVGVSEHVYVSMKTIPDYCGIELSEQYRVEDCHNKDVGVNMLSCISGKLDYMVNEGKKTITVHVSNFLEEYDYNVRLCLKHYSCHDIGAHAMIKKDNSTKSVTLPYSVILPCLCIEGWSALPDSRRTRLCPFKNDIGGLWDNITYNLITQGLTWKSLCPVNANVNLCWMTDGIENEKCVNIPNSLTGACDQATYNQVDTHSRLCMKFSTDVDSMVKCPFVSGQFSAWHMKTLFMEGTTQIIITSPAKAKFSVFICNRTHLNTCDPVQIHALVYVGASDHVTLNLSREICGPNICVQSLRIDVTYSFPVQICDIPCILEDTLPIEDSSLQMLIVGTVVMVLAIIFTLVGYIILKVWHQKKLQKKTFLKSKVKHFWK